MSIAVFAGRIYIRPKPLNTLSLAQISPHDRRWGPCPAQTPYIPKSLNYSYSIRLARQRVAKVAKSKGIAPQDRADIPLPGGQRFATTFAEIPRNFHGIPGFMANRARHLSPAAIAPQVAVGCATMGRERSAEPYRGSDALAVGAVRTRRACLGMGTPFFIVLLLSNRATGDSVAGIPRRVCLHIIGLRMDH